MPMDISESVKSVDVVLRRLSFGSPSDLPKFTAGDLLWSKPYRTAPWWPCMVIYEPNTNSFTKTIRKFTMDL